MKSKGLERALRRSEKPHVQIPPSSTPKPFDIARMDEAEVAKLFPPKQVFSKENLAIIEDPERDSKKTRALMAGEKRDIPVILREGEANPRLMSDMIHKLEEGESMEFNVSWNFSGEKPMVSRLSQVQSRVVEIEPPGKVWKPSRYSTLVRPEEAEFESLGREQVTETTVIYYDVCGEHTPKETTRTVDRGGNFTGKTRPKKDEHEYEEPESD
ncbi:MAG: hypothetical protein GF416_01775 [Candidatus Altiarchaeales archaeon]|nr:hypothetical protein [Candidatus Altiarchaeales archaeon]MBD3415845.1 hypothetical protein [Candidatus Altiarchaeales archaeon]